MKRMIWIAIAAAVAMIIILIASHEANKIQQINAKNSSKTTFSSPDIQVGLQQKETDIWDYIDGLSTTDTSETTDTLVSDTAPAEDSNVESDDSVESTVEETKPSLIDKINGRNKTGVQAESQTNPVVVIN